MGNMNGTFTQATDAKQYVLAGNARVTLQSQKTGVRYTYRVRKAEDNGRGDMWFVSLLTGADNESDYTYMGIIGQQGGFRTTAKSRYKSDSTPVLAFDYSLRALTAGRMPPGVEVSHEGRCGRCGRALTVPSSVAAGIGPECAEKMAA